MIVDRCPSWVAPITGGADVPGDVQAQIDWHNLAGEEQGCWLPPEEAGE